MNVTVDTNILLRAYMEDDVEQTDKAIELLGRADKVAIGLLCLCEFVWVLTRRYKVGRKDISVAIRTMLDTKNVVLDRPAVEAGLEVLEAGGDFADGVIAFEGGWLGGETFVS